MSWQEIQQYPSYPQTKNAIINKGISPTTLTTQLSQTFDATQGGAMTGLTIPTAIATFALNKAAEFSIEKLIEFSVTKYRRTRYEEFLTALYSDGITQEQLDKFLEDESQQQFFEKAITALITNASKISRLVLGRIIRDQVSLTFRFKPYDASRAVDSLRDLDDVDSRLFIYAIEFTKNTEQKFAEKLKSRPLIESTHFRVKWEDLSKDRQFLPHSIENEAELLEVIDHLVQRNLLRRSIGLMDTGNFDVEVGELGLKLQSELKIAANLAGFSVPDAAV